MTYTIDPYKRVQVKLTLSDVFPQPDKTKCACGCGEELTGRQTRWSSKECNKKAVTQFFIIKGDTQVIRQELFKLEKGICQHCGEYDENWEADHILPVFMGGGGCDLGNFQTLCKECHKKKTRENYITSRKAENQ